MKSIDYDVKRVVKRLGIDIKKKRGHELYARCPNLSHMDKTPSWSINEITGAHHCFGCEYGGSLNDLVKDLTGLSLKEFMEGK